MTLYCAFYCIEDISKSTDEVLIKGTSPQTGGEDGGGSGERRMSSHKRSRSEGSTATTAINVIQPATREKKEVAPETDEREASPPYVARLHKCRSRYFTRPFSDLLNCLAVETTSCTEGLKLLLDYKQKQYAEGMYYYMLKIVRTMNQPSSCSFLVSQICRLWTTS